MADAKVFDVAPSKEKPVSKSTKSATIAQIANEHSTAPVMTTEPEQESKPTDDAAAVTVTVRREKTLDVPVESASAPASAAVAPEQVPTEKPEIIAEETKPEEHITHSPSTEIKQPPSEPIVSDTPKQTDDRQLPPGEQQQVPKIFDSTQYQLPIQTRHKASATRFMIQFLIGFLLIGALLVVIAQDAGWIDLGIELPFNFF